MGAWEETYFNDVLDGQLQLLEKRAAAGDLTRDDVDSYLHNAYMTRDDKWIGSGTAMELETDAKIAALELVRSRLV